MSTPYAKRRRLNEATKTLHKPFKSPFKTPSKSVTSSDPPSSDPSDLVIPDPAYVFPVLNTARSNDVQPLPTPARPEESPATPAPPTARTSRSLVSRSITSTPSRSLPKKTPSKPSLTREIVQLRSDIQILSQAERLATSTEDDNLIVLIDKWRTASRAAAEELFGSTRDRVNRMGGVGAWKEREKEAQERTQKWDQEERQAQVEAERERLEEAKEKGEVVDEAYDKYADMTEDKVEEEEEKYKVADDDVSQDSLGDWSRDANGKQSFTMDMMLKTLNIDLGLIGYSKEAQRWDG
ncbi:hypothetical protein P153DRAFT_432426 [Dothidotthia symphoricarpi CBS 119687]|uniref:Swi5-domain-containing protein n=1 Tax=Dothidotthia symphoricarpi CBS 119687 TaxID=1392245 RepID=A0A6A6A7Q4_9PLEO|nr:uncharacterized protein P153DRAFT_432426 [Dothidotthia symphoricarpi CBS 119687]KAF2128012.1 hypothetical protein P153DRAFT_432426 [Dothidotthia symphoricarpi CBS 119687]